ncbi:MAG TPA: hypothetical protein VGB78_06860 [Thermoplasmata archaeon]|jgi:hypothetical protein
MKRELVVRRGAHICIALAPVYYLLPEQLPVIGVGRWVLLVVFIVGIAAFEAHRLRKGITFLGLRPHEKGQIASFVWAAAGITVVLWLVPHDIATAALIGMAFVDPLAGELRHADRSSGITFGLSFVVYFSIAASALALMEYRTLLGSVVMGGVGSIVAVASESYKTRHVDDDFLMAVAPAGVMWAASVAF